jgi:hypothetical protein
VRGSDDHLRALPRATIGRTHHDALPCKKHTPRGYRGGGDVGMSGSDQAANNPIYNVNSGIANDVLQFHSSYRVPNET